MQEKHNRWATIAGALLGTVLALAASSHAQQLTEEFHQQYPLPSNGSVKINNVNGVIKIAAWDQDQVKVDAVKRAGSAEKMAEARIVVEPEPNSISIATQYPERAFERCNQDACRPAVVDYTITVPRGARLQRVRNVNGSVEIAGVRGEVSASSVNGRVSASGLSAASDVSTVNGSVDAAFDRFAAGSKVHSVNGRVTVTLPSDTSADVRASSLNGSIRNDFGIPAGPRSLVGRDLEGRIGNGGPQLRLETVNGGIEIRHADDGKPLSPGASTRPQPAPY